MKLKIQGGNNRYTSVRIDLFLLQLNKRQLQKLDFGLYKNNVTYNSYKEEITQHVSRS